jgi:Large polyvalent protein associated domain 23
MPIGTDDGETYKNRLDYLTQGSDVPKYASQRLYVTPNDKPQPAGEGGKSEGDIASTMPAKAPTEPTGALKSEEGSQVPEKVPETKTYDTKLTPEEEATYKQRFGEDASRDYDMRGYYKANPDMVPNQEGQHYPDTYKKPNHPTFSDESIYHGHDGNEGGHWGTENGQDTFTPGPTNLKNWGRSGLQDYFKRVEPNVKLNLPEESPISFLKAGKALNTGIDTAISRMADLPEKLESMVTPESLKGFYEHVKDVFSLPGDAFAGKIDPMSEQGIEKANELASMMVFGPAPVARSMADGTLGSFAGLRAKSLSEDPAKVADYFRANEMEEAGQTPTQIWNKTGFMRGVDNKWRHEIDDSTAKFDSKWYEHPEDLTNVMTGGMSKLSSILDHPELYKAYPGLKDVLVEMDPLMGSSAHWSKGVAANPLRMGVIRMGPGSASNKGILMHEVQHAIQDVEGFSKGGAPGRVGKDFELRLRKEIKEQIHDPLVTLLNKSQTVGLNPEEEAEYQRLNALALKAIEYTKAANLEAFNKYQRLAGEVEARNTDTRLLLGKAGRRSIPPTHTEDTPREQQIHLNQPALATAYGVRDPLTGDIMK